MDNKAFFNIGYGLYVLTTNENKDNGCIINTFMQVTDSPKRVVLAVNKDNLTCKELQASGVFNVSVIDESADFDLFKAFGFKSGRTCHKFDDFSDVARAENGVLYITKSTNAYFSGRVIEQKDLGTHILFIADITEAEVLSDKKTVTYTFYQEKIKPAPEKKKGWVCKICGYVYEGEELPEDFICPLCKHPASDFEKL